MSAGTRARLSPMRFVVAFGVISLLADFVYEGGRSIIGPYLGTLGASGATVGLVAGAGEAIALVLRLAAGAAADRTRRFWAFTIVGYTLTLVSVPLLAATGHLGLAVGLYLTERLGKAVRTPARDTMLAAAGADIGRGWTFAVHEAMDQLGAVLGPLLVAVTVARTGGFPAGFAVLAIPAALTLGVLGWLRRAVPDPLAYQSDSQPGTIEPQLGSPRRLGGAFWRYLVFSALAVTGLAPFALASFHAETTGLLSAGQVPLLYALAMAVDAGFALAAGRLYDRRGLITLGVLPILAGVVPAASFSHSTLWIWVGAGAWGAAMGLHESILRAAVADLTPTARRATAYGIFAAAYGAASLAGDTAIGLLYDRSRSSIIVFVVAIEALALAALHTATRANPE